MKLKFEPLYCICGLRIPQRLVIIILCILGLFISRVQRSQKTFEHACNRTGILPNSFVTTYLRSTLRAKQIDYVTEDYDATEDPDAPLLVWKEAGKQIEKLLLTYGYLFGQWLGFIPAGILADRYTAKWFYCGGMAVSSVITAFIPILLIFGMPWYIMIFIRMLLGISQSVIFPCIAILVAHWVPFAQRGLLGAFCFSSYPFVSFFGESLLMYMHSKNHDWPYLYYIPAGLGLVWCALCVFLVYETPNEHPRIPEVEQNYLIEKIPEPTKLKLPYVQILQDRGVWALILGQIGHDFSLYILRFVLLKPGISVRIVQKFALTTVFFFGLWPVGTVAGFIVDNRIKRNWDVRWTRRGTTCIAFLASCGFLTISSYMNGKAILITIFFGLAIISLGPNYAGQKINHMDLTVNFNGTVMGIMCFASDTSVIILGTLSGNVIAPENDVTDFHKEAWFMFAVNLAFTLCYMCLVCVERSKWDIPPVNSEDLFKQYYQ